MNSGAKVRKLGRIMPMRWKPMRRAQHDIAGIERHILDPAERDALRARGSRENRSFPSFATDSIASAKR